MSRCRCLLLSLAAFCLVFLAQPSYAAKRFVAKKGSTQVFVQGQPTTFVQSSGVAYSTSAAVPVGSFRSTRVFSAPVGAPVYGGCPTSNVTFFRNVGSCSY